MRSVLIITMLLIARPAVAMNWEGHDDAFADDPYAKAYMQAAPHAETAPESRLPGERRTGVGQRLRTDSARAAWLPGKLTGGPPP